MNLTELLKIIEGKTTKTVEWEGGDFLSNLLMELASYYSTLGEFVANAERDSDFAETQWKVTEAESTVEYIEQKLPVARAEELAKIDSRGNREGFIEKKHKARLLFLTRQNLAVTIDAIRSRLSYLKSDKEGSRNGV